MQRLNKRANTHTKTKNKNKKKKLTDKKIKKLVKIIPGY